MTQFMPAVLKAIPEDDAVKPDPYKHVTRSGVVLKLKPVPPMLVNDVRLRHRAPPIPKVKNLDKGDDVWEENPNDPEYVDKYQEWQLLVADTVNATILSLGTTLEHVPDDVPGVDDASWADDVKELTGLDVPTTGRRRYYCWLKYVVLTNMDDWFKLIQRIQAISGVTLESEVAQAIENFRDNAQGDTPGGVRPS